MKITDETDWPIGDIRVIGKKMYGRCCYCDKIVQINKRLFGDLHLCLSEKESNERQNISERL